MDGHGTSFILRLQLRTESAQQREEGKTEFSATTFLDLVTDRNI